MYINDNHFDGNKNLRRGSRNASDSILPEILNNLGGPKLYSQILYVDGDKADNGDGSSWENAFNSMESAINVVQDYGLIVLRGSLTESIATLNYLFSPSYVTIVGVGGGGGNAMAPYWEPAAVGSPCIILNAVGWQLYNIKFASIAGHTSALVKPQVILASDYIGIRTKIAGCTFHGNEDATYGIDLFGAPYEVIIDNCNFSFFHNAGGTAKCITSSDSSYALAYRLQVKNCTFIESDAFLDLITARGANAALIKDNVFQGTGKAGYANLPKLNLGSGDGNIVVGNSFGGTYSKAGGYTPGAGGTDNWAGNTSPDSVNVATVITQVEPA